MKLEYIIIFKEEGVPIYSNCFGSFCARVGFDETLYSGFLSALTTMPSMFGDNRGIRSVEMGFTTLHFSRTTPSGHNICVGIDKSTDDDIDVDNQLTIFYSRINSVLEEEYKGFDWTDVKNSDITKFRNTILHEAIYPTFPYFNDKEVCSKDCPFDHNEQKINPQTNKTMTVIERFEENYSKKNTFLSRLIGPIYLRIYRWFDLRSYRKSRELVKGEKITSQS